MDQAQAASLTRHLVQLANAYESLTSLRGLAPLLHGTNRDHGHGGGSNNSMEDLECHAAEIAGQLSQRPPSVRSIATTAERNNNLFDLQWRKLSSCCMLIINAQ